MMSVRRSALPVVAEIVLTGMDPIRSCGRYIRDFLVFHLVGGHGGLAQWHVQLGALLNEK